jgi:outer membrane protein insertion porin family
MKAWKASRPEEKSVTDGMQALEGKTIVDIVCTGASEATAATAKAAIAQRAGDTFSTSALEKDRAAVYATGYFYDLYPTFEQVPEGVVITYHLLENPVLKSVAITGNTVETTDVLQKMITVKPGMILNGTELQKDIRNMEEQYRKDGYILAKISDLHINRDGALNIVVNEGILEDFKVKGNTKTKDYVVLREMRLKKGEPFNVKKARRSMQRVYNLGFFEDVNMKLNPGVAPNAIVLEIDVVEKRTGSFGIGAGYSSQDGMVGMISLGDTNFRGTGDAVSVQYEFSGDDSDAHGYTFSWRHPYMDKKETVGTFRVYNRTYEYYDYDTNGDEKESYMRKYSGGEITLGRPVSEYSTNYITLRNRNDKYEKHEDDGNVVTKNANGTINWGAHDQKWKDDNFGLTRSITLEHVTDTRDNIYFPTTGGKVSLSAEIAGLGGDFDYRKYIIEDQRYFKVGHAQVIALRGQYGYGDGNIPESAQFRIGGQDSLRGYRDDQFRGDNMCLATLEYRFPIVSKVQGALFTDWGTAWNGGWRPEDIHGSIGVGLQLQTPLGPLRLDYAHGSQRNRLHFSVGGTF